MFSDSQLTRIIDQATIYMCACPAQVGDMVYKLRHLFAYQQKCLERSGSDINREVHDRIALATSEAHRQMEICLQDILHIEKWDMDTLEMPEGLRQLRDRSLYD